MLVSVNNSCAIAIFSGGTGGTVSKLVSGARDPFCFLKTFFGGGHCEFTPVIANCLLEKITEPKPPSKNTAQPQL